MNTRRIPVSAARCRSGVSVLLAGLLLAGCSSTQFFYNRLDIVIGWYVDDYVDFSDRQQVQFDAELESFFDWHQREELPIYVAFLSQFEHMLDREITAEDVDNMAIDARAAVDRAQVRIVDLMLRMGATLTDEQVGTFLAELDRQQAEDIEEYLGRDDDAYRRDALESLERNLKRYLGKLTPSQKTLLSEGVGDYIRLDQVWLDDRAEWNALLHTVMTERVPGWETELRNAVNSRRAGRGDAFEQSLEINAQLTRQLIREVINMRTARQDVRLRKRVRALREDFAALVEDVAA